MGTGDNIFTTFDKYTQRQTSKKNSSFVKKVTLDLDAEHLQIIEERQKMAGIHSGLRGVVWEALELLAEKYQLNQEI